MSGTTPGRPAALALVLQNDLKGAATVEIHPLDLDAACWQYADDGFEVPPRLRDFLENYGELTLTMTSRKGEWKLTTSVEQTLGSTHADPRNIRIFSKELGGPVLQVGTAFDTEEAVLLAENGDVLFAGDAGYQRIANGFGDAMRALATGDWDRTFF